MIDLGRVSEKTEGPPSPYFIEGPFQLWTGG
jgi:hypothetical protein